jgi:Putative prokaryotic signal transducing protein
MDQLTYEKLLEVNGRLEAEMIESLLEAEGIDVELVQESIGHTVYPVTVDGLGRVQIFVPKDKVDEAREWLKMYREGMQEE